MAAPTVVGSDGALTVSWTEPHNEGSKIHTYTVFLYPESGGQPIPYTAAGTDEHLTIPGLKNGALYSVRIQAQNDADKPSLPSDGHRRVPAWRTGPADRREGGGRDSG